MQGAYLAFLSSPILPAQRTLVQPHARTVSPHSPKPCAGSCLVSCQPLALASPCCPHVLSVQPVPWHGRGAACVVQPCPVFRLGFLAQRHVCCARCAGKPALLCRASSVTHAVSGAVASGCRAAGRDCSAELPQHCQAAANATQAESAWVTSERKKTSVLGSPASAGPPAAQCLTCWGSLCRAASASL